MGCTFCLCKVGITYELEADCVECGNTFIKVGTYIGIEDYNHTFRMHPKGVCPKCGIEHKYIHVPCRDVTGFDVTEEYRSLSSQKSSGSYWKGY